MKNVNLFPYRQQRKWLMTRRFQRSVLVTAMGSVLLAMLLSWSFSQGVSGLWSTKTTGVNASANQLNAQERALIEEMYQHIQSTQTLQEDRRQRLVVLQVIHGMAQHPLPGVSIKHVRWEAGVLHVDAWISSQEQATDWVQRLQAIPGVTGIETVAGPPDGLASELSMQVLQLKLKVGGADAQHQHTKD